jgi:hypothetical protein
MQSDQILLKMMDFLTRPLLIKLLIQAFQWCFCFQYSVRILFMSETDNDLVHISNLLKQTFQIGSFFPINL